MLSSVAGLLDSLEGGIDKILDATQDPSLSPSNAGSVDPNVNPSTLGQYADTTHDLMSDAVAELQANGASYDAELVGTKLRTVQALLDGYRDEAGIE